MWKVSFVTILVFSVNVALGQSECVLKKDKDSVKVYTCHSAESKFKTVRASFTVNASLSQLVDMVLDIENYIHWQYNTINPRVIEKISDHELIYYTEVESPWPVSNRDLVVDLMIEQDPKTKSVKVISNSLPKIVPTHKNLVRIPYAFSQWTISKVSESKLKVDYTMKFDPGGSVPAWVVNMFCEEGPYITFRNLRDRIPSEKNKLISLPFIVN